MLAFDEKERNALDASVEIISSIEYSAFVSSVFKSSLSIFQLEKEVKYLEQIEQNVNKLIIDNELSNEFVEFKHELIDIIEQLSGIERTQLMA